MLATNKELLSVATTEGYAVGAFNIQNLETLLAVVEASTEEMSPVIVAATPSTIRYAGVEYLAGIMKTAAESVPIPMSLHLDHGKNMETVSKCIDAGFTSVMIDGSQLSFEGNISLTKQVVDSAHSKGVSVEGELGRLAGVEEATVEEKEAVLTDPLAAEEFVKRTDVDALAVALGTSHGAYKFKGEPRLDFERLKTIRRKTHIPLVLHGASGVPSWVIEKATKYGAELEGARGIPDKHVKKAVSLGISKINIDTDLRLAFTGSIRELLAGSPKEFDPRKILGSAKTAMKKVITSKMRLFGSSAKAL
ncbi:MAG: class II fructose-1,6-bisphosphate aldolase [Candidatus Bathyarchaeota archaeon]|nr:MAG: class II fructose-1,6-bisphosphate aldolase [Candidatus Bathyarchaeota archaeon]